MAHLPIFLLGCRKPHSDRLTTPDVTYYRLKQTGLYGTDTYGSIITVKNCGNGAVANTTLYPNPSAGIFNLLYTGDRRQVYAIKVFNSNGDKVYGSTGFQPQFDLSGKPAGVYFVQVCLNSAIVTRKMIIEK
jgi:hypothetical protein